MPEKEADKLGLIADQLKSIDAKLKEILEQNSKTLKLLEMFFNDFHWYAHRLK